MTTCLGALLLGATVRARAAILPFREAASLPSRMRAGFFVTVASRSVIGLSFALLSLVALVDAVANADDDPRVVAARAKVHATYPACAKTPTKDDVDTAKGAHIQASKYFEHKEFDKAIQSWTNAYGFDCTRPSVFLNLANAYEGTDKAMSVALVELYEERDPGASHAELDPRVAGWRVDLARTAPSTVTHPTASSTPTSAPSIVPTAPASSASDTATVHPFGPAPWIVFGVGAAVAVAGAPVVAVGRLKVSQALDQCGGKHTDCTASVVSLGNTGIIMTRAGVGMLAGGAAVAVAGLAWQFGGNAARPAHARTSVELDPIVGPGVAAASIRGRF